MSSCDGAPGRIVIDRAGLDTLLDTLKAQGYALLGPTVRDQAIVYDEISGAADLPVGWTDRQEPGSYRLERRGDEAWFGYVVGPHSWKQFLFPPEERLYQVTKEGKAFRTTAKEPETRKRALIGVRACELAAIGVQDRVFIGGLFVDPHYKARRDNLFVVAVNCGVPASTCFCTSMGTGPEAKSGFDLALTEVLTDETHEFVAEAGSTAGTELLSCVPHLDATEADEASRRAVIDHATHTITRSMETGDLKDLLYRNQQSSQWEDVAQRCLSCANCTMVCPTCFCSTVEDVTDLTGDHAERWRKWDSCFTMDYSYVVGGSVRASTAARYRHWITHKLASWQDQFQTNGCVGCGRCLTWCPVGIDITEEVEALRKSDGNAEQAPRRKEE